MSRIDDTPNSRGIPSTASDAEEARTDDVGEPITARMGGTPVDGDVAPMLPDLLTRPEAISGRPEPTGLRPPRPTNAVDPPSPTEELQVLRQLESKLDTAVGQIADRDRADTVDTMLRSLRHFRRLREEVVMRADV